MKNVIIGIFLLLMIAGCGACVNIENIGNSDWEEVQDEVDD